MSYSKTNWVDGQTPLSAQNLNKIENAVADHETRVEKIENGTTKVPNATQADSSTTLNGLTASVTELNHTDGVTSNIQTQLNDKAPKYHGSTGTTYGVGTISSYGHCKLRNDLGASAYASGEALSAHQGYLLGLYAPSIVGDLKTTSRNIEDSTWKLCDGRSVSKTSFSAYNSVIGGKYGYNIGTKTTRSFPLTGRTSFVSNGGSTILAYNISGTKTYAYSTNGGVTWSNGTFAGSNSTYWVVYGNGVFVAISYLNSYNYSIHTSTDAINWTKVTDFGVSGGFNFIKYVNGYWYEGHGTNGGWDLLYRSTNLSSWTQCNLAGAADFGTGLKSIAYGNSRYIASDWSGRIAVSTDGVNFTLGSLPSGANAYDIEFFNGKFIIMSYSKIFYSIDGVNWSEAYLDAEALKVYNAIETRSNKTYNFSNIDSSYLQVNGLRISGSILYYIAGYTNSNTYNAQTKVFATFDGIKWYVVSDPSDDQAISCFSFMDNGTHALIYKDDVLSTLSGVHLPNIRLPYSSDGTSYIKVQ